MKTKLLTIAKNGVRPVRPKKIESQKKKLKYKNSKMFFTNIINL